MLGLLVLGRLAMQHLPEAKGLFLGVAQPKVQERPGRLGLERLGEAKEPLHITPPLADLLVAQQERVQWILAAD